MVELRNVSKAYKNNILFNNLNITVPRRDICGILGENGSGKSVLLKMICGFALPDAGEVFVGGERIEKGRFPPGHRGDPGFHRLSAGGDGAGQSAAPGLHPREGGQGISICCGQACEAAFMKKSIIHNKGIYGEIREIRDIRKADLAFELDSNSKAQQNIERDVAVVSAFVPC